MNLGKCNNCRYNVNRMACAMRRKGSGDNCFVPFGVLNVTEECEASEVPIKKRPKGTSWLSQGLMTEAVTKWCEDCNHDDGSYVEPQKAVCNDCSGEYSNWTPKGCMGIWDEALG